MTFASRTCGEGDSECPIRSTRLAGHRLVHSDSQESIFVISLSRNRRAALALETRCKFPPGGLPWARASIVFPVGSRLELATSSRAAAAARAVFASICDISNFPTAVRWNYRPMWRIERVRVAPARHDAHRRENNFARRNRARVGGVECLTPGGVPPSPQPLTHPAKDPGPSGAGVFFCLQRDNDKASAGRRRCREFRSSSRRARCCVPSSCAHSKFQRTRGAAPDNEIVISAA